MGLHTVPMVADKNFILLKPNSIITRTTFKTVGYIRFLYIGIIFLGFFTQRTHAKIGYFWHISDLHLDTFYSTKGDIHKSCWHMDPRQSSSSGYKLGRFGEYLCDSPWSLLESATLAMKSRQGDNVEFVLWTGDGLSDSSRRKLDQRRLEILSNITDLLGRTFSSQFVFPVLGHNDGPDISFRRLGELWRQWLPSEALQTFEKGGYYTIEQTKSRLRIIALNTNFMQHDPTYLNQVAAVRKRHPSGNNGGSNNNNGGGGIGPDSSEFKNFYYHHGGNHQHHYHGDLYNNMGSSGIGGGSYGGSLQHHHYGQINGNNGGQVSALSGGGFDNQDSQKQWDWLEDVLAKSKINKETVYIVGHMPPGSDERIVGSSQQHGHSTFAEKNNLRYLRLVRKYSSIIQGQFFGHLHSDSFRIIYDDKGKPVSWIMISPSVTPRKMSVGSNNPAMRLYKFDTDSGQVLDYTQYYLDLTMANTLGEANWIPEYNLTHYYGLADISAISLHNFADRFTMTDNSWFPKYYRANTVRHATEPCEGICMLNHYCAITRVDYVEYRQCLEKEQSALRSNSNKLTSSSSILIILMLLTILLIFNNKLIIIILTKNLYNIIIYFIFLIINIFIFIFIRQKYKIYKNIINNEIFLVLNLYKILIKYIKLLILINLKKLNNFLNIIIKKINKNDDRINLIIDVNKLDLNLCQIKNYYYYYYSIVINLVRNNIYNYSRNILLLLLMLNNFFKNIYNYKIILKFKLILLNKNICSACKEIIKKQVLS